MKQMELQRQQIQQLVEENARLNSLIHHRIENQGMSGSLEPAIAQRIFGQGIQAAISIPRKHMTDTVCVVLQVSTEMVEWSPLRATLVQENTACRQQPIGKRRWQMKSSTTSRTTTWTTQPTNA